MAEVKGAKVIAAIAAAIRPVKQRGVMMPSATPWQHRIAHFYGTTDMVGESGIGEVRFAVGWLAHQVGRLGWRVQVNGEVLDERKSREYVGLVADRQATEQIAANLSMFGELDYVGYDKDALPITENALSDRPVDRSIIGPIYAGNGDVRWRVVSVVDDARNDLLGQALFETHGIVPHPTDPEMPDAAIAGVVDVLEEIEQLTLLTRAQNRSRLSQIGILGVASELSITSTAAHNAPSNATGNDSDEFAQMLNEVISSPMADPETTGATPILLRAPAEMLASGGWARWLQMSHSYDELLSQRLKFAIQRLAWGLPMPPEILLGMAASNRAVAFQVEEASYREHIEPFAVAVGGVYAAALAKMIDVGDDSTIEFIPDPTMLLARQHSVEDAFAAWEKGLASASWVREVLGIPEEAAATEEDLRILAAATGAGAEQPRDKRSVKDGDPAQPIDGEPTEGGNPSREAVAASAEPPMVVALRTAIEMAIERAREKVGAKVRTSVRDDDALTAIIDGVPNGDVLVTLGDRAVRFDVDDVILNALGGLKEWWVGYLGDTNPGGSTAALVDLTAALARERLNLPGRTQVPDEVIAEVLASI